MSSPYSCLNVKFVPNLEFCSEGLSPPQAYLDSVTGLAADVITFTPSSPLSDQAKYILRPETVESYFVLWRLTKQPQYRDWGWQLARALEKHCRLEVGYSGIRNVNEAGIITINLQ